MAGWFLGVLSFARFFIFLLFVVVAYLHRLKFPVSKGGAFDANDGPSLPFPYSATALDSRVSYGFIVFHLLSESIAFLTPFGPQFAKP